jgi:hypothetical protein
METLASRVIAAKAELPMNEIRAKASNGQSSLIFLLIIRPALMA